MKYKLIALDLDRTTASKNKIFKKNIIAIKWLIHNNIKVIIATGRSINSIRKIAKKIDIIKNNMPVIGFNGGIIYDFKNEKIIKQNFFSNNELINFFNLANNYKIKLWAYSVKNECLAYVNNKNSLFIKWISFITKIKTILINNINYLNDQSYKIIVIGKKNNVLKFKEKLLIKYKYNIFNSSYFLNKILNLEISPKNSDKKNALEYLAKIYNIKSKEIVAIGDGFNDYEMLKWAGLSIAVSNAKYCIKIISDEITSHYRRSGVAKSINKYFKK